MTQDQRRVAIGAISGVLFIGVSVWLLQKVLPVPAVATSAAGTVAVSWFALTNVVERDEPLNVTKLPLTNPEPFAVNVNCGLPATVVFGEMLVSVTRPEVMVNGRVVVL